jgi:hypothetical protein
MPTFILREDSWNSFLLKAELIQVQRVARRIRSIEKSSYLIEN